MFHAPRGGIDTYTSITILVIINNSSLRFNKSKVFF
jgi:hypothetical protein